MARKVALSKKDEIANRRRVVATMRLAHLTQEEIAHRLGVSAGTISGDMQAIRQEWAERRRTDYDEWVGEELAKLDRLEQALIPKAVQGDPVSVDRVLSVMDRRARLLGLDKPERFEHTVITEDAIDAEIRRLEADIAAKEAAKRREQVTGS